MRRASTCTTIASLIILSCAAASVHAVMAPEERLDSTPSGWFWLHGVTAAEITEAVESANLRLIDLEIQSTAPLLFSAVFVQNSGVHASAWWWYYGISFNDIGVFLEQNQARLIDIERDDTGKFAVIMVPNTGAQAKAWWYYGGITASALATEIDANGGRLVDIESFTVRGTTYYDAIMVENSGDDASGWHWWLGTSTM